MIEGVMMASKVILLERSRSQIGEITAEGQQIVLDVSKNIPSETAEELSAFLRDISMIGSISVRVSKRYAKPDTAPIYAQEAEKVSLSDPRFFPALADRINHAMSKKHSIYALVMSQA